MRAFLCFKEPALDLAESGIGKRYGAGDGDDPKQTDGIGCGEGCRAAPHNGGRVFRRA